MVKVPKKSRRTSPKAKKRAGLKVLGVTKDGVRILQPKYKATHFTDVEIRHAVAAVKAKSA